jgi:periplasmic protein TonB
MNPVSESRSLPSTLAIVASLVLVCGGLLLLTSTAPWTSRPDPASETSVAANGAPAAAAPATFAVAPPANSESSPAREETEEADRGDTTQIGEAQPQQGAPEPAEINYFDQSFAQAEAAVATSGVATSSVDQIEAPDEAANAADVSADISEVDAPEVEAEAADAIAAESMSVSAAEPMHEDTLEPGAAVETADAGAGPVTPPAAEPAAAEPDQIGAMISESPPQAIATETIAEHDNEAATPSPAATSAEKTEAPVADRAEAPSNAPAQATRESTSGQPQEARIETAAAAPLPAPPPLPKRKPEIQTARAAPQPEPAPSRKETPKQAEARPEVAQAEPAQPGGGLTRWLPMALAPADKPVAKQPQRLTGQAYSSKVWSALARHKPRAGQSGSATVVFSIGMGGSLNSVSIGKSSGNARIDQLALATVRGAAPFPPPTSGPASFTIRIDFH